ncbi:MAG: leucyl aminopeptidase [Candidatus Eisenbacteria bacterium]
MTDNSSIPVLKYRRGRPAPDEFPLVAVPIAEGEPPSPLPEFLRRGGTPAWMGDFRGEEMEALLLYGGGALPERILLVGLGKAVPAGGDLVRRWASRAAREARRVRVRRLAILLPAGAGTEASRITACAHGAVLGSRFAWTEKENAAIEEIAIFGAAPEAEGSEAAEAGLRVGEAVLFARRLAMTPPNRLSPARLAEEAERIASETGAKARVMDEKMIEQEGLLSLLAVGTGSANPPRFIEVDYDGSDGHGPVIGLVGKGITFDSGGLSLKPADRMAHMKYDMSGAAAVLAATRGAARLRLPLRVVAVVPSAENMPGPRSYRPGDVIASYKGLAIEVDNTDAEGRLILGDGLAWAEKNVRPDILVNVATLTGAVKVALGRHAAGLFSNDDDLADEMIRAGDESGERVWRLPLWDAYDGELKSDLADIRNVARSADAGGASIVAAKFLHRFVERTKWANLDIAGVAWSGKDHDLGPTGPTGYGTALLIALLRARAAAAK